MGKSFAERIFLLEQLERIRKRARLKFKERIAKRKENVAFLMSGFETKAEFLHGRGQGYPTLKVFKRETGFLTYNDYLQQLDSGFSIRAEWEESVLKGFSNKAEFDLAKKEGFDEKNLFIEHALRHINDLLVELFQLEEEISFYKKITSKEFEIERTVQYRNELLERKQSLENNARIKEQYLIVEDEDCNKFTQNYEEKRLALLEQANKLLKWLEERFPYLENWRKVLNMIKKFRYNIPVQLDRVAELVELPQDETAKVIRDILEEMPALGEYLELEQVFIKQSRSSNNLVYTNEGLKNKIIQEMEEKNYYCLHCSAEITSEGGKMQEHCTNCGTTVPECRICRGYIFKDEEILVEQNCGAIFHKRHVIEWVNVRKNCPVCRERINIKSLVAFQKAILEAE